MSPILQTVPLGSQWPTLDPFLFCAHHLDDYPASNGELGPDASLGGRQLGSDFAGVDGWNMYHGSSVPGFPQHPHRGFETVTYVRSGYCDHSDSLGAQARFGQGDVQWLTAGAGVVHSEMFPLFDTAGPNPLHLFQMWLNLPAANKMVDPYFSMLWSDQIPKQAVGTGTEVTVIAGELADASVPAPPPDSWASVADSDVAIWHIQLDPGAEWTLPVAHADSNRVLYVFDGTELLVADQPTVKDTGVVLDSTYEVSLRAPADGEGSECLLLQGRPIGEPVAQYGPFVMNTEAEIREAMADYQRTRFGGWPWSTDDPVHGTAPSRFARRANGEVEEKV